jgi:hypothetical protein
MYLNTNHKSFFFARLRSNVCGISLDDSLGDSLGGDSYTPPLCARL